jgi:putative FmdB family regulatory protein
LPTYQYSCTACGHGFEIVQSFTDDALTVCPECSGRLRKIFNAVGVVFKGSGFYRTDSRKAAEPTSDSKSDGAKSDGAKSDGATSDGAKPESTSGSTKGDSSSSGSTTSDAKSAAKAPATSNV